MQLAGGGQALDGADLAPVDLHGQHGAGLHCPPVDEHRARAAVGRGAAHVRARDPEAPVADPPTPVRAIPALITVSPDFSSATATPTVAKSPTRRSSLR